MTSRDLVLTAPAVGFCPYHVSSNVTASVLVWERIDWAPADCCLYQPNAPHEKRPLCLLPGKVETQRMTPRFQV